MDLIPTTGARALPVRSTTTSPVPDTYRSSTVPPPYHYELPRNDGGSWSVRPGGEVTIELWINGKRWRSCDY